MSGRSPAPALPPSIALTDPVSRLPGVGAARAARLAAAGLATVADVLLHLPFRYEDRRHFAHRGDRAGRAGHSLRAPFRRAGDPHEAGRSEDRGDRRRRQRGDPRRLAQPVSELRGGARAGRSAVLYGSPSVGPQGEIRLENPETEFFEPGEEADPLHSGRIVGVARRVADISPRAWRALVRRLSTLSPRLPGRGRAAAEDPRGARGRSLSGGAGGRGGRARKARPRGAPRPRRPDRGETRKAPIAPRDRARRRRGGARGRGARCRFV